MEKPAGRTAGRELEVTISPLIRPNRDIVQKARLAVVQNVNSIQVVTDFEIGRRIVEHEQQGEPKAGAG
ncbi:DUF1016 domain-containing protein [Methanoculleus sp. Afa-1]|uniref:DUF1016 domain-containing protein n=1 Tax=Methanoculleus formosensis TaxID=2590886 RepID=A0A9E5DE46_9EURY|nr:hypothetical protein [Methanoculleus sp. Afa-1]MCT8338233.1 DUF1016 domain-containing protein [Methanoculleus sp. Afa-1]